MSSSTVTLPETLDESVGKQCRCQHCGTRFQRRFEDERFCCSGCRVVSDLIHGSGFESFYELLGKRTLEPANQSEIATDQLGDLATAIDEAEENATMLEAPARLRLRVGNLSCTACVWLIDHLFPQQPGHLKISSDTSQSIFTLWWEVGNFDAVSFVQELNRFGYPPAPVDETLEELPRESRNLLTRMGVTGGLALNAMAFSLPGYLGLETSSDLSRLFTLVAFASAALALAIGGSYFFQRALASLRLRTLHMDVPISLGLIAAFLGSIFGLFHDKEEMLYFDFVATFAFLMLLGRWIHLRLIERNRQQLWARERQFSLAHRIIEGEKTERIPLAKIEAGDLLSIPAGAMVPVDSILAGEDSKWRLDWINGEPDPIRFSTGRPLQAGARNAEDRALVVRAEAGYAGSFLQKLLDRETQATSASDPAYHPGILKAYLLIVITVAIAGGAFWWLSRDDGVTSLQVFISVLVVSCPCALGLALPLLDEMVLSQLRQRGVFVRQASIWRRLRSVRILAFDKTGTLTDPVSRLTNADSLDRLSQESIFALQVLCEGNRHPVGLAIQEELVSRYGLPKKSAELQVMEERGQGREARFHDKTWRLGRRDWAAKEFDASPSRETVLTQDGKIMASFHVSETLRDGAFEQI
ncbi:MAG: heavy metal translocating P-type ATPase metal-binding domain-containing protein, partial [Verrucomicrobiota bacterium]